MARVTTKEVKEIIQTELTDLTAFITSANVMVTDRLADAGLGDSTLKEIERWTAAHFLAMSNMQPQVEEDKTGDARVKYMQSDLGKWLDATTYGQTAKTLDTSGTLEVVGKRTARITTIDYADAVQS